MSNLGLQSTVVLITIIIWDAVLIVHLISVLKYQRGYCAVEPRFGIFRSGPYHLLKVMGMIKQKGHALQWYTIQYTSFPEIYGFQNIPTFRGDFISHDLTILYGVPNCMDSQSP